MGFRKVHGLPACTEGSVGETPKENSSVRVKQNCLLPACNSAKIIRPNFTPPEVSHKKNKSQARHPALCRYTVDLVTKQKVWEVFKSPCIRE